MISITTVLQIHIQIQAETGEYKYRRTRLFQVRAVYKFLASVLRYEERDTVLTMLTIPNVRRILWRLRSRFISAGRDPKNSTLRLNGRTPNSQLNSRISTICLHGSISTSNWHFFQNPQILITLSSRHDVIHTPAPFPVWGFIMTYIVYYDIYCHILCVRA